jgi:hypothetical protein
MKIANATPPVSVSVSVSVPGLLFLVTVNAFLSNNGKTSSSLNVYLTFSANCH